MKKTLLAFVFALSFFGVANANGTVVYPSTFSIKVGEEVNVSNYQNLKIKLDSIKDYNGECDSVGTPCPLGNPVSTINARKVIVLSVSTEGGCGPDADSRCLGAPGFSTVLNIKEGSVAYAKSLGIKVNSVSENSANLSVFLRESNEGGEDGGSIVPMPPEEPKEVNIIPIGRDFGDKDESGVEGEVGKIEGKAIVYPVSPITICPMGKENCTVCSNGSCKEKTVLYTEGTANAPGLRKMVLPENEEITSVEADKTSTSSPAYSVKAVKKERLFFIFPVETHISYSIDAKTGSSTVVQKPWWSFLAW